MKLKTTLNRKIYLPASLGGRVKLSREKASGFRILKRVLQSAALSERDADKINRVLAAI